MTENARDLLGLVDPSGVSLGFLVPLFTDGKSNAPLVQRIATDGKIAAFEPYEAPDAPVQEALPRQAAVGGPAVHAFAFGDGDVLVVEGEDGRDALRARIGDPALQKRPMLAMELAAFLNLHDLRCELASEAHALMSKASVEIADRWLDLSVLTPELRRVLASTGERTPIRLASVVVARRRRDAIEILGVGDELSPAQSATLQTATLDATAGLERLYPAPAGGWRVQVRKPSNRKPRHHAEAAVLLASDRARRLARGSRWPAVPNLDIHTEDGVAFTRVVEETEAPLFVVYGADEPDVMHRAVGDLTSRDMHGIALDAPRPRMERDDPPQPWNTTHVPIASFGGGDRGEIAGVRLAVAVELDRRTQGLEFPVESSALLRSRGIGPDPDADAWAALYDRAWGMGLAPWRAVLIAGRGGAAQGSTSYSSDYSASYSSDREPGWAARTLFDDPLFLNGALTDRVMGDLRATAALLVERRPRQEPDLGRHRSSITRLLERQRWNIEDEDFRNTDARLTARGRRAEFRFMVRPNGIVQPEWKRQALFEIDLMSVDRLLVSGPASPGAVLSHLSGSGELVVGMRDLTTIDAAHATPLTIMAVQLRRQVTSLPSSARTHFVALVAMQALRGGRVDDGGRDILGLVEHPGLGRAVHLVVGSTRTVDNALVARIRILDGTSSRAGQRREIGSFAMTVASDFVSITATERPSTTAMEAAP